MQRPAARAEMIHARIDSKLKWAAERVFTRMGLSTTEAIHLFFEQVVLHEGLPFSLRIPNAETVAAMKEASEPAALTKWRSFRELRLDA